MKSRLKSKFKNNNSGFIIADFLFAFVMVIGIGIFMFALTFSLATIEVGQYIVWSTARNYSAANKDEPSANQQAQEKFTNLASQFPLLTNIGGSSGWFELSKDDLHIGELDTGIDPNFQISSDDKINNYRQPWTGVSTTINLKLFAGLQLPFLGKIAGSDSTIFKMPIRAFIIRHVSKKECNIFFYGDDDRYDKGIQNLENGKLGKIHFGTGIDNRSFQGGFGEDNGC